MQLVFKVCFSTLESFACEQYQAVICPIITYLICLGVHYEGTHAIKKKKTCNSSYTPL